MSSEVSEFLDSAPIGAELGPAVPVAIGLPPHTIREFSAKRNLIWCSCLDGVARTPDEFQAHRAAMGLVTRKPPKPAKPIERWHPKRPNRCI